MSQTTFTSTSLEVNKTSVSVQSVSERLEEADLGAERFIPVEYEDGHKKPTERGWQSRQYAAREIQGPAGVTCGNGLVVVDLDTHMAGVEAPDEVEELPDTFTAGTMHGGEHQYLRVVGEQPRSRSRPFGDIQSSGSMVVAPGAEFSHAECGDCEQQGVGRYPVLNDVPIATVDPEDYPEIFGVTTEVEPEDGTTEDTNPSFDVNKRLTFAVDHDEKFRKLWQWGKNGRSTDDNSSRETALAEKLLFYLGSEKKVRKVLSSLNLPKWGSRGEYYRNSVMKAAHKYAGDGFNPEQNSSGSGGVCRDTAIRVVAGSVLDGLFSNPVGRFTADDVDVSKRHVQKILNALEEAGYIRYERDGRQSYWCQDDLLNIPAAGDEFYQQFNTRVAVNQQRHSWMQNHDG